VVLLDGLQRTPMSLWLPSLVEVVAAPSRPRNLLLFASLSRDVLDPGRAWPGLERAVIGLVAARSAVVSPHILATASGSAVVVSNFDAKVASTPSRSDVLEFIDDHGAEGAPAMLERTTSILRAAWALAPAIVPSQIASAFVGGNDVDDRFRSHLVAGAAWLRSVQSSFEASRE
jgi:hypothetical protein